MSIWVLGFLMILAAVLSAVIASKDCLVAKEALVLMGATPDMIQKSGLDGNNCCGNDNIACNNDRITTLAFRNTQLGGILPDALGKLDRLEYLILYNNSLSGPIPESLTKLKHLKYLSLWNNNLTGPIPASIGDMDSLVLLRLENNPISGKIPHSILSLDLKYLYFNLTQHFERYINIWARKSTFDS
jgi:Leucine-rich repeat (LRR) protein